MTASPTYTERLGVPLRWWVQGTMLVATLWLAVVVAVPGPAAWVVTAIALAGLFGGLWSYGNPRISVDGATFRAGRAHIAAGYVGAATALDADQTRRTAGREADARAYLMLRPYLKRAVRVEILDPADPTPYWLVSSRRPEELARALTALGQSVRG
ncbi:DUF3093 family protein [Nocardioides sp. LMS-CY]|uniref:DUF3093 domain-containing protein n=1 Tax=Nocardioides soli TaxID=1036020 RepID=A0A7W4W012_9ACTN|nr:DUF3093 domain-containing protein [Nocardioides sp. LMS-CY]MBB3044835.1 hypothetical protein [Nocardioides soli]QWF24323.1 DUF3093 family protein [Nocardioides sp. LMS-CY]